MLGSDNETDFLIFTGLILMLRKAFIGIVLIFLLFLCAVILWPQKKHTPFDVSKAYQAQADAYKIYDMPNDWTWKRFEAADGTSLRWGETGNAGAAKASLILVPGYTTTLNMYGEHVDILAGRGFHVIGLDLRGQGGSDRHDPDQPEKLWVKDFSVYSDDLAAFIKSLPRPENRPLIPVAMSFGGHVALRMAGDHPGLVDGLFLLAPAIEPIAQGMSFDTALFLMRAGRFLGKGMHYVPGQDRWSPYKDDLSLAHIDWCSSNPARLHSKDVIYTRLPEQRVGGVTFQYGSRFFESSRYIRKDGYLEAITVPTIIASAEVDHYVSTAVSKESCDARLPNCERLDIADSGHCLPQESDEILSEILEGVEALYRRLEPSISD